ncbi:MAG: hypothetical protein WBO10_16460 [Pyrinomonadaceae bacterium]
MISNASVFCSETDKTLVVECFQIMQISVCDRIGGNVWHFESASKRLVSDSKLLISIVWSRLVNCVPERFEVIAEARLIRHRRHH